MTPLNNEDAEWKAILDAQLVEQQKHNPATYQLWLCLAIPVLFGLVFHGAFGAMLLFLGGVSGRLIAYLPGTNRIRSNAAWFRGGCVLGLIIAACWR